jgi:uncharacterized DUF497 family protein
MDSFEWDEAKRLKNLGRHGLDFSDADVVFDGRPLITVQSGYAHEVRFVSTALMDSRKFCSIIWTWRGEKRRIISFRRARHGEEREYRQLHGG